MRINSNYNTEKYYYVEDDGSVHFTPSQTSTKCDLSYAIGLLRYAQKLKAQRNGYQIDNTIIRLRRVALAILDKAWMD